MRRLAVVVGFLAVAPPGAPLGDCGRAHVVLKDPTPMDRRLACEGIDRALGFFAERGIGPAIPIPIPISISFADEVRVPMVDQQGRVGGTERVYGYYDNGSGEIHVSRWGTEYLRSRTFFAGLPITEDRHASVVAHEVTHRVFDRLHERASGAKPSRAVTEFVAYTVQIATLRDKDEVAGLWPGAAFSHDGAINTMVWAADPSRFGLRAWRRYRAEPTILDEMLDGRFESGDSIFEGGLF